MATDLLDPWSTHSGQKSVTGVSGLLMISNRARSSKSGALREMLRWSGLLFARTPSDYLAKGQDETPRLPS